MTEKKVYRVKMTRTRTITEEYQIDIYTDDIEAFTYENETELDKRAHYLDEYIENDTWNEFEFSHEEAEDQDPDKALTAEQLKAENETLVRHVGVPIDKVRELLKKTA